MGSVEALKVDIEPGEDAHVIRIQGSLGVLEAEKLERSFNSVIARRPKLAVVDLSEVTFMSSLGMGALVGLHRSLKHFSGTVRLAAPPKMVLEALERAKLHEVMKIFDDVPSALA